MGSGAGTHRPDAEAIQVTEDLEPEAYVSAIGWGNTRRAESLARERLSCSWVCKDAGN